jgi:hypothetical protein
MKILSIIRRTGNLDDAKEFNGKLYPFKSYLVLIFSKYLSDNGHKVTYIFEDEFKKENKINGANFFLCFDLIIQYSLKNEIINENREKISARLIILETPVLKRLINEPLKNQKFFRVMLDTHLGNNIIKKYQNNELVRDSLLPKLEKYKEFGEHILLVNQIVGDTAVVPYHPVKWIYEKIINLRKYSDKKIIIREHPLQLQEHKDLLKKILIEINTNCFMSEKKDIDDDLENAAACVTLSSSASIDALIKGIPIFVEDQRSFAYEIANLNIKNINNPINKDREALFKSIVNIHWSVEEIKNGKCWFFLKKILINK